MIKIREIGKTQAIDIALEISKLNCSIFNWVNLTLMKATISEEMLTNLITDFMNIIESTYPNRGKDYEDVLSTIEKESAEIYAATKDDDLDTFERVSAIEIGINSEAEVNYTIVDRMTLILVVARRKGLKFDFS